MLRPPQRQSQDGMVVAFRGPVQEAHPTLVARVEHDVGEVEEDGGHVHLILFVGWSVGLD